MSRKTKSLSLNRLFVSPQWRKGLRDYIDSLQNVRVGSPVSRFFRHVFEHKHSKKFLGSNLAILMLASSFVPANVSSFNSDQIELNVYESTQTDIFTNITVRKPLNRLKINQGYHFFHPGIDFDGDKGDPIYSIMDGVVVKIERSPYAYGNSIVVDHQNGYTSRYAHLSKIDAFLNQKIDVYTKIGEVGSTGRSTGDHLHLEVYENGRNINPLSLIPLN